MPDQSDEPKRSWLEGRRLRRQAKREIRAERRARGNKKGDVLSDAPSTTDADRWGRAGGGFSTKPTSKLGE